MSKKTFVFINKYKKDWKNWWSDFSHLRNKWVDSKKDFQITIEPYKKLRGEQALKGYWVLIGIVQKYINDDCGNNYTKEEISDYFKLRAGHKKRINSVQLKTAKVGLFSKAIMAIKLLPLFLLQQASLGNDSLYEYLPRSIANNSGCTYEDMKKLIDYILRFGAENNIIGCELKSSDWEEFKVYYNVGN